MRTTCLRAPAALILATSAGQATPALAQEPPGATATATAPAEMYGDKAAAVEKDKAAGWSSPGVPRLHIVWDCGDCVHNEKVPPLIEEAYAAEASSHGQPVSGTEVAEVAIVSFRQRPPGARVAMGLFAGKDRLGLRIRYRGQEYAVADSSSNILMGQNYLSESVGKEAYEKLAPVAGGR